MADNKTLIQKYMKDNTPKYGKDIDFMGSFPGFKDTGIGSGRGRGDGVMGSGPGGAAATARKVSRNAAKWSTGPDDYATSEYKGQQGVDAQKRSIDQLKEVRAIYKNAIGATKPSNSQKAKKVLKLNNQRKEVGA